MNPKESTLSPAPPWEDPDKDRKQRTPLRYIGRWLQRLRQASAEKRGASTVGIQPPHLGYCVAADLVAYRSEPVALCTSLDWPALAAGKVTDLSEADGLAEDSLS